MRNIILLIFVAHFFVLTGITGYSQTNVNGYVFEINSNNTLSNANVFISGISKGTVTNRYGYYEMKGVPPGHQKIVISLLGYETVTTFIQVGEKDSVLSFNFEMTPRVYSIGTVEILSSKTKGVNNKSEIPEEQPGVLNPAQQIRIKDANTGTNKASEIITLVNPANDMTDASADNSNISELADLGFTVMKNDIRRFEALKDSLEHESLKNPKEITTRLKYAALLEICCKSSAFNEYEDIIKTDPSCAEAWYRMGKIKNKEYSETRYAVINEDRDGMQLTMNQVGFGPSEKFVDSPEETYARKLDKEGFNDRLEISLEPRSREMFADAEKYLQKAISANPASDNYYLELCLLYENADKYDSLKVWTKRLLKVNANKKDAHLLYGLAAYKTNDLNTSWNEYETALKLMSENERKDYEFNSVIRLLEPVVGNKLRSMNKAQKEETINLFWKSEEPLNLTEYNERLLEHYSRVTYANLHFSVPKNNIAGWNTDRGDVYLRYGHPQSITNYPPSIAQARGYKDTQEHMGMTLYVPTELWKYKNMDFSFSDYMQNGNYEFSDTTGRLDRRSRFKMNTKLFAESTRKTKFEKYDLLSEAPSLEAAVKVYQFKNLDDKASKATDFYVNFALPYAKDKDYNYKWGFFCLDNSYAKLIADRDSISEFNMKNILALPGTTPMFVSSHKYQKETRDVKLDFEALRSNDNSIFRNRGKLKIKDFSKDSLMISDIVLSSRVEFESNSESSLNRNSIWMLPNPSGKLSLKDDAHIYFEIYNLGKILSGENDYEQEIIIKNKRDNQFFVGKMIGSLINFFDSEHGTKKITSPTKVKTYGKNQQICFQLGIETLDPGEYNIEINLKDNVTGQSTSGSTSFILVE